jgi:hypothetical protein
LQEKLNKNKIGSYSSKREGNFDLTQDFLTETDLQLPISQRAKHPNN